MVIWVVKVPGRGSKIRKKNSIHILIPRLETRQPILPKCLYAGLVLMYWLWNLSGYWCFLKSGKGNSPVLSTQKQAFYEIASWKKKISFKLDPKIIFKIVTINRILK